MGDVYNGLTKDITQFNNHGTPNGLETNAVDSSHHGGNSLRFSGDLTSLTTALDLTGTVANNNLSLSCWVNVAGVVSAVGGIFCLGNGATEEWSLTQVNAEIWAISQHGGTNVQAKASVSASTWTHYVGIFEAANSRKIYKNGVLIQTETSSLAPTPATKKVTLGSRSGPQRYAGKLEGCRLYNRVLTLTEIQQLYTKPYAGISQLPDFFMPLSSAATETGTGTMSFTGISFVSGGTSGVFGTGDMAFSGIAMKAQGIDPGAPGSGLRQFGTF